MGAKRRRGALLESGKAAWHAGALLFCLLTLTGCGKFFQPVSTGTGSSSGSGSGSGTTVDAVYIANGSTSLQNIAAFSLNSGVLANLQNPQLGSIGVPPSSLAINPQGTLLWVGSGAVDGGLASPGGLFVYVINSNGSLTLGNSGSALPVSIAANAMAVDPSGNYLAVVSNTISGAGLTTTPVVYTYSIDQTNGTLTQQSTVTLVGGSASQIAFAPNGTEIFVTLGTFGVATLGYDPQNGGLSSGSLYSTPGNGYSDVGVAVDPSSKYLFVTETGTSGVRVFSINLNLTLTELTPAVLGTATGSPYPTALGPGAVLVDSTGAYVYVANSTASSISQFSLNAATGALTSVGTNVSTLQNGSSIDGAVPISLAEDSSHGYLLVATQGGSPDLEAYAIAGSGATTPGALTFTSQATTGSVSPAGVTAIVATP